MTEPRVIAEFSDYPGMVDAFRLLAIQRKIAVSGDANEIAGLPSGYIQKLIGVKPVKRMGMTSLGALLGVLGAKLILVEDPESIKRFGSRIRKRDERFVRSGEHNGAVHIRFTRRHMKKIGKAGGKNSRKNMDAERASEIGRKASTARWEKARRRKAVRENSRKRHAEATR